MLTKTLLQQKNCMKKVFSHFQTIKDNPGKFVLWIFTSIILALSTVWIPALLGTVIGNNFFPRQMENNPFIVFSVVFLSNSVLTSINYIGAGSNNFAVSVRGVTLVVTILYLIFLSTIIPLKLINNISVSISTQFILLIISLVIGIYVYGFREANWEKSVDEFRGEQEEDVSSITQAAVTINNDGQDIQL